MQSKQSTVVATNFGTYPELLPLATFKQPYHQIYLCLPLIKPVPVIQSAFTAPIESKTLVVQLETKHCSSALAALKTPRTKLSMQSDEKLKRQISQIEKIRAKIKKNSENYTNGSHSGLTYSDPEATLERELMIATTASPKSPQTSINNDSYSARGCQTKIYPQTDTSESGENESIRSAKV